MTIYFFNKIFLFLSLICFLLLENILYLPLVFLFIFFVSFFSQEDFFFLLFLAFLAGILKDSFSINHWPIFSLFFILLVLFVKQNQKFFAKDSKLAIFFVFILSSFAYWLINII